MFFFLSFLPLEVRTVLSDGPEPLGRPQRSRVPRCAHQPHQQGQEPGGGHQPGAADSRAAGSQEGGQGTS